MTLHQLLNEGTNSLLRAGAPEAQLDARRLLLEAFHLDTVHFLMNRMQALEQTKAAEAAIRHYRQMIKKRCSRIPLQHILGNQDFMGLTFKVNKHVLIPRQDTETLVELVLEEQKDRKKKVLDLCTGSGCIAVSLAVLGGYEDVTAVDLSLEALNVASENAGRLLDGERSIRFLAGDLFEPLNDEKFDIITANPPYIPTEVIKGLQPEVRDFEPVMALDGDKDGLGFYRRIAGEADKRLNPGGCIYLEIGHDQGEAVSSLLEEAGFKNVKIIKDAPGLDRVVRGEGGRHV
ncbi:MAG: peptide chain release factor N(5)-glutamine methyltransferase [Hungatella sp.]|nr:peptide chain release factor N(5)-glutamine methyltransferase [Hungatella sp.]